MALVALTARFAWETYTDTGLFIPLGSDFGLYFSQAVVLQEGDASRIYDISALDAHFKRLLTAYGRDPIFSSHRTAVWGGPVPYPPVFASAMQPFTLLSPPWSFLAWTALNVAIVMWLGVRLATPRPGWDRLTIALSISATYPVVLTLLVGQLQLVMALALTECLLALRAGKDLRAGVWFGLLLLKPHYGIVLGPLLLWKRRWKAVAGVAITGTMLIALSIVLVGLPTVLAYPDSFFTLMSFRGDDPSVMINWRSVLLDMKPSITDRSGVLATAILGCLTLAAVLWTWRGPWRPGSVDFLRRFTIAMLGTLLVTFHSHPYGAVLFITPFVFFLAHQHVKPLIAGIAALGLYLPTLVLCAGYEPVITNLQFYWHLVWASRILKAALLLLLVALVWDDVKSDMTGLTRLIGGLGRAGRRSLIAHLAE